MIRFWLGLFEIQSLSILQRRLNNNIGDKIRVNPCLRLANQYHPRILRKQNQSFRLIPNF